MQSNSGLPTEGTLSDARPPKLGGLDPTHGASIPSLLGHVDELPISYNHQRRRALTGRGAASVVSAAQRHVRHTARQRRSMRGQTAPGQAEHWEPRIHHASNRFTTLSVGMTSAYFASMSNKLA